MKQVVDHAGVLLEVDYTPPASDEGPTFHGIHLLDEHYRSCGPDIAPLLHNVFVLAPPCAGGGPREAESFLSHLVGELCESHT